VSARKGAWILVIALVSCGKGIAQGASARDCAGKLISLQRPASRVLALSRGAAEALKAIGTSAAILLAPGGDPPDLVIYDPSHESSLESLGNGIPVFFYDPADFKDLADAIMALGALVGDSKGGVRAAARLTASVGRVHAIISKVHSSDFPRVLVAAGTDPLCTYGSGSFVAALVAEAGGKPLFADLKGGPIAVGLDEAISRDPQVIVSLGQYSLPRGAAFPSSPRVLELRDEDISSPGPSSAAELLELARAFHPELIP
jgi:iron complex transport system substrate-binding protein